MYSKNFDNFSFRFVLSLKEIAHLVLEIFAFEVGYSYVRKETEAARILEHVYQLFHSITTHKETYKI